MKRSFYTIGSIIILIIAGLVFVAAPALVGSGQNTPAYVFGSYNGKKIKYEQGSPLAENVTYYADMYSSSGIQVDTSTYYYIFSTAFNQTVQQMAYTDAVEKSGWSVPDAAVSRALVPYFSDENGNYSPRLYHQADKNRILELRTQISRSLLASRYYDDVFGAQESVGDNTLFGIKTTSAENDFINSMGEKERSFDMAIFNMANYPDAEIVVFGKANADKFVKYNLSVITAEKKSDAENILRRIKNESVTFEDAVGESESKPYSDTEGKLNQNYHYQLARIIADENALASVIGLGEGELSAVIKTDDRYSIFRADAAKTEPDFSYDSTVRDVLSYLNSNEAGHIEDYYMEAANNFVAALSSETFRNAANTYDAEVVETVPFPLNYGSVSVIPPISVDNSAVSAPQTNEQFLTAAFSLKEGETSSPLVMGNSIVVMRLRSENNVPVDSGNNVTAELKSYDSSSSQNAIMSSDKLENNLVSAFFSMMN